MMKEKTQLLAAGLGQRLDGRLVTRSGNVERRVLTEKPDGLENEREMLSGHDGEVYPGQQDIRREQGDVPSGRGMWVTPNEIQATTSSREVDLSPFIQPSSESSGAFLVCVTYFPALLVVSLRSSTRARALERMTRRTDRVDHRRKV